MVNSVHINKLMKLTRKSEEHQRPVPRLWIRSAEVRGGDVVSRMETQQQQHFLAISNCIDVI